jgi:hypothetical protein
MIVRHRGLLASILTAAALVGGSACSDEPQLVTEPGPGAAGDTGLGEGDPGAGGLGAAGVDGDGNTGGGDTGEPPGPSETGEPDPSATDPNEQDPTPDGNPDQPSGTDVEEPVTPPATFIAPRGPCPIETRVGSFAIEKQVQFGVVQGSVADGVVPTAIPRLALEDGTCRLLERRTLSCIPACVGAQTCGEDGACIPYPRQVSVGTVTIAGLTKATTMSPLQPGNSYFAPGADNPPYAVGSEVTLAAAGDGPGTSFSLFGLGSEPLAQVPTWQLVAGQDLEVTWPAPTSGVAATVLVELMIDQHGASPLTLSCEFPDTGSALVPSAIVDRMIDSGVSGFPNGRLMRRTADHVDIDVGCVELAVGSPLAANVTVSGFTPCNSSAECPSGQICNIALQRCE